MASFLKNAFRSKTAAGLLGALCAIELAALALALPAIPAQVDYLAAVYPKVLIAFTNNARVENQAGRLALNPVLSEAARMKAEDMATKAYFAHISPDGVEPWYWFRKAGYQYRAAGENLAVNYTDSDALHNAWMDSPGHRANILRPQFTEIGIGTAVGTYKGKPALFVVQMFGAPLHNAQATETAQRPTPGSNIAARTLLPTAALASGEASAIGSQFWQLALASPLAIANMLFVLIIGLGLLAAYLSYRMRPRPVFAHILPYMVCALFAGACYISNMVVAGAGGAIL